MKEQVPGCRKCVCTLLCYWSNEGDLCRRCVEEPGFADLFVHHMKCPQGWVYSASTDSCFKAFTKSKIWRYAKRFCKKGGGNLAEPRTNSSIQAVLEAINTQGQAVNEGYWIGGRQKIRMKYAGTSGNQGFENTFQWQSDKLTVDNNNWAFGFPMSG